MAKNPVLEVAALAEIGRRVVKAVQDSGLLKTKRRRSRPSHDGAKRRRTKARKGKALEQRTLAQIPD